MDGQTFDDLVKRLAAARLTRLDAMRGLLVSAVMGLTGATLSTEETVGKKHGKRKRTHGKGKKQAKKQGTDKHKAKGKGRHRRGRARASAKPTCGKAGAPCGNQPCCGNLICPNGTCLKASPSGGCDPNQIKCNGVCTNMDNANCGACGATCQGGQSCVNGTCTTATTTTTTLIPTTTTEAPTTTTTTEAPTTTTTSGCLPPGAFPPGGCANPGACCSFAACCSSCGGVPDGACF